MADLRQSLIETLDEKDRVTPRPLTKDDYVDAFVDWLFEQVEKDVGDTATAWRRRVLEDLARDLDLIALGTSEDEEKGDEAK